MFVSYTDIFTYVGTRKRPLQEGEAVFNANHVIKCGLQGNKKKIFGLVVRTSALNKEPHEVNIFLDDNPAMWKCKCTCKAGAGGMCKHVIACLIYGNRKELEELSQTDLKQAWGKSGKPTQYSKSFPVAQFCHVKNSPNNVSVSDKTRRQNLNLFLECKPTSALAKLLTGRNKMPDVTTPRSQPRNEESQQFDGCAPASVERIFENLSQSNTISVLLNEQETSFMDIFYKENILITEAECINICQNSINQNNMIWKTHRLFRITGSRCYALYTYRNNINPDWRKKVASYISDSFTGNEHTEYGLIMEPEAAKCYEMYRTPLLKCGLVIHPQHPYLAYSPDAVSADYSTLIEIKCPVIGANDSIGNVLPKLTYVHYNEESGIFELKKKHKYFAQVQFGMLLLNLKKCDFVIYCSFDKSCAILEIDLDYEFSLDLLKELKNIYFTNMLPYFYK